MFEYILVYVLSGSCIRPFLGAIKLWNMDLNGLEPQLRQEVRQLLHRMAHRGLGGDLRGQLRLRGVALHEELAEPLVPHSPARVAHVVRELLRVRKAMCPSWPLVKRRHV